MSNKKETPTNPLFVPFVDVFLARRDEISQLVSIATYSIHNMKGVEDLSKALKKEQDEIDRAARLEATAMAEVNSDFPILHGAATILIWGALETSIRDFLIRWIQIFPEARQIPELERVRIKLVEYENLNEDDRMRYLLDQIDRDIGGPLRAGAGRFECLLKPFNLKPKITAKLRRELNEICAVRNVLVHQAGKVDMRFNDQCPKLKKEIGDTIKVSRNDFMRYLGAASKFVIGIIEATTSHPFYIKEYGDT